ncbi:MULTISPECIES: carbon starvation CstA family protein [Selenomonas]|uniref:Carbon starvation protein CstA n=1 Tax=Selenomonas ruminantium TaxID=971 RepID=A0A1K1N7D6_SELRU|nr:MULTISPECIES: carbon starvation CstA family protein [Selenomonas]SFW31267.1 Carbon starvation protein CstA [Selenomonas ruminantium]
MVTFLVALGALIVGYFVYGKIVDNVFGPTDAKTPALVHNDGVDYIPLPTWKVFLIQLLNIAGLGPIFGALGGAIWGPSVYLWIVFGTIFAGAVHDYLSGMISLREDGKSISEVVGNHMGGTMLMIMRVFSVVLLVLVGTVFMTGPAGLLAKLTGVAVTIVLPCVLGYYFLATLLPIDKLIARFYPLFGICLIIMALGIMGGMLFGVGGHTMPELTLQNLHPLGPEKMPIWPLMFITVACGAISGFHSTQSPIMARCLKDERLGRPVFYGAMVSEGIIALIWAAAGVTFYDGTGGLAAAMKAGGAGTVVYDICVGFMGTGVGAVLAMLGVIACPITSGDTAFRSARLTLADWFGVQQNQAVKRLMFAVPLLAVGGILSQMDFNIIWRYFSWTNQTLAMIVLWTGAVYLYRTKKDSGAWKIPFVPATFMSAVSCTYILQAPEGLQLSTSISYPVGILFAIVCVALYYKTTMGSKS